MTERTRRRLRSRLEIECLEQRCVPAGNLSVVLNGGTLVIRGDDLSNGVEVTQGAEAGQFVVTGLNVGGATTVNGQAAVTVAGVTGDVIIDLRGGDDQVVVGDGVAVPRDLRVRTGLGNDTVTLADVTVGEDLTVETGLGNDTVSVADVMVGGDSRVETGGGNDTVQITDSLFSRELRVILGDGDDALSLGDSMVGGDFRVEGGAGVDEFTDLGGNVFGEDVEIRNVEVVG